eukprot:CAMPEP_0117443390 /NCGR_PEP_ID=MMETSP0759-20121206/4670_1 /TAXON_ID=63605 /ORGANISM="Percolomonas cosmopolitus, Strain WS" /LENGTH=1065 /DNA_ID=CAMNT_0005235363 /DNA_START=185 /DNA_END=3382 /DNA_ORIENTATION=+
MNQILDFSAPLDVQLLDRIVGAMYQGNPNEIQQANEILTKFQQHANSWTKVIQILQQSSSHQTKIFAVQILNQTIRYKWNILPDNQQVGMKNFLVNIIIEMTKKSSTDAASKLLLQKLNESLIQIVKKEWPTKWPNFIPELVQSSRESEALCENNMKLLKLLSEEVFDFSKDTLTTRKTVLLKQAYKKDFMEIFRLCEHILQKATSESLILETLQTLLRFIGWIPMAYIFETNLIQQLVSKFLPIYQFRNDTMRCLAEIAAFDRTSVQNHNDTSDNLPTHSIGHYDPQFRTLFKETIIRISETVLPMTNSNIPEGYRRGSIYDQQFIQIFGLFLTNFFEKHLKSLEHGDTSAQLKTGHEYLLEISKVNDTEVFKACLDYWKMLSHELYAENKSKGHGRALSLSNPRTVFYSKILSDLRYILVSRMAKPEEVIIVEDENGNLIKERYTNVASIELYNSMRKCLIFLTNLDYKDMENIMTGKLERVQHKEWSWQNLNTLCWAIGSISGHMGRDQENRFLVTVIKALLELCDQKAGKPNKAVVASNIMYVVGQYPDFLNQHWRFLQTVVHKLFEFMHEQFEGVQEMACDTFLKICEQCSHKFVHKQHGDKHTFIDQIIDSLGSVICDLDARDIHTFYEAMGHMIREAGYDPQFQKRCLAGLMRMPNEKWKSIVQSASENANTLKETPVMKNIVALLKTNVAVCKTAKTAFESQITLIFSDMFEVYKLYSQMISQEIATHGAIAAKHAHVRHMSSVKKEVLHLVETFFVTSDDTDLLAKKFVPPLLQAILTDYYSSVADAKDANVLSLLTSAIQKLKREMTPHLPQALKSVLETTIPMIKNNFSDYPDHRKNLFLLLRVVNKECFQVFFQMEGSDFQLTINSVLWAIKHHNRQSYETGLMMLDELLTNIEQQTNQHLVNEFYKSFFSPILTDIFGVLTDTMHMSGFKYESSILRKLIGIVSVNALSVPLFDPSKERYPDNRTYSQTFIANRLTNAFPNLRKDEIQNFVVSMFQTANEGSKFTEVLRDFLVVSKEWSSLDTREMYFEERERERQNKEREEQELREASAKR